MEEKQGHLSEMVKEFLTYKKVQFKDLSSINVKQSNIVIGYMIDEKHPHVQGKIQTKEKFAEYNLSFMLSFLYQKASMGGVPAQCVPIIDSDLVDQIEMLRKIVEGKNTPQEMEIRGLNERIDQLEEKIGGLQRISNLPTP